MIQKNAEMMQRELQKPSPKLLEHPLMGIRIGNLYNILSEQGPIPLSKWPYIAAFTTSALARLPFSVIDRWLVSREDAMDKLKPPVFVVGYWRSGTTHLHNLLACSPDVGIITPLGSGLPDELLTLGTWFKSLLEMGIPDDRGVDQVAVTPQSPQEDEIPVANLQPLSVFQALYFPGDFRQNFNRGVFFDGVSPGEVKRWKSMLRYFLGKVALHQNNQPLLIKNPVYTARIKLLRSMWPQARFIHIYRNPYEVYRSNIHYYPKMVQSLGLQPYKRTDIEPVVLNSYPRMLDKLYKDVEYLPEGQFTEIRYEKLIENPIGELEGVYKQLHLPGWQTAKRNTETYLKSIANYRKNRYSYKKADYLKVEKYWGNYVQRWGYESPVGKVVK